MELAHILKISGGAVALLTYLPLIIAAARNRGAGHSFATWVLWAVLDWTATVSIMVQRGNFWLVLGLAVGSVTMALLLLFQGRFAWSWLETAILALVLACLGVWMLSGPKGATVATTLAIILAGIPGMVELWRSPQRTLGYIWSGFTVANLLALWGGADWSIAERFAPAAFTLQTLAFVVIAFRSRPSGLSAQTPGR